MFWQKGSGYQPVDAGDDGTDRPVNQSPSQPSSSWVGRISVLLSVLCFIEGITLIILFKKHESSFQRIQFEEDARFTHLHTVNEVEKAWSIYDLPDSGFVHITMPETLGLIPNHNVIPGTNNVYMISAFHQLHCLEQLQKFFAEIQSINKTDSPSDTTHTNHESHCIDYLRQGILCGADMTLEGPDLTPIPGESPLRGWGVTHSCRSWDRVLNWRDQHAITK